MRLARLRNGVLLLFFAVVLKLRLIACPDRLSSA
jgi:hypothetical protein